MNAKSTETAVSPKGERHRLTVLFADLVGSTVLGREMESEYFSELLGKLRAIWHRAAAKHGGRVIRTQGDGVLAVFGYPSSGEDDGRRAAEAALDIHEWVGRCSTTACCRLVCRCECIRASMPVPCCCLKAISNGAGLI